MVVVVVVVVLYGAGGGARAAGGSGGRGVPPAEGPGASARCSRGQGELLLHHGGR